MPTSGAVMNTCHFPFMPASTLPVLVYLLSIAYHALAQTAPPPAQPSHAGTAGQFEIVGNSLVSAQQMFLGTPNKVYIIDKTENNPAQVNGHPAWASEYDVYANNGRSMDVITNTFCAGGNVLGNGTWLNVGGNTPVTYGGINDPLGGGLPYDDPDGSFSVRLLNPCDDGTCDWVVTTPLTNRRWYPTLETIEDGSIMIFGGCEFGGYVNDASQNNPTYEFFPSVGDPITLPVLQRTLPANLYPLVWLLPSGNLLIQTNWATVLLNYHTNTETPLDDIPDAVRTYPASAGTAMLPLTPGNNWTATIMFCGGSNLQPDGWDPVNDLASTPTSTSCVQITPDTSGTYIHVDPMPEGRSMGTFIFLPNGKILCLNGANSGTAGYGNTTWAIGQSFATKPVLTPVVFDPTAPAGSQWSRDSLSASTIPRMYHSAATLLPDGSVLVSGSNPNADFNVANDVMYPTEYRVERFYPSYYNNRRPQPEGLLQQLSYGGPYFNVSLSSDDLFGDVQNVQNATVVIVRTGFSTHAMNMGQRLVVLDSSYTGHSGNNTATLHVSQLPPNPAILVPGPALLFVVVNGTPSVGISVMIGSGQLGTQQTLTVAPLPGKSILQGDSGSDGSGNSAHSGSRHNCGGGLYVWLVVFALLLTFFDIVC